MSPRAAWRLEQLGFTEVYDYVAGKVDWIAAGLPTVRAPRAERRAIDAIDRQPPTATIGDRGREVAAAGGQRVIVVNNAGIVLGRVDTGRLAHHPDAPVEELMTPGPTTVRAHEPLDALRERMRSRNVSDIVVTTPEGRLLGLVRAADE